MRRLCRTADLGRLAGRPGTRHRGRKGSGVPSHSTKTRTSTTASTTTRAAQVVGLLGGLAWVAAAFLWEGGDDPLELGLFWLGAVLSRSSCSSSACCWSSAGCWRCGFRRLRTAAAGLDGGRLRGQLRLRRRHRLGTLRCRGRGVRDRAARPRHRRRERAPLSDPARSSPRRSAGISPRYSVVGALWRTPPTGRHARGICRSCGHDQPAHLPAGPAGDGRRGRHERLRARARQAARRAWHRGRHLHPLHVLRPPGQRRGGPRVSWSATSTPARSRG